MHEGQLLDQLGPQVPREDEDVVRFVGGYLLGRQDRDAGARGEPAVLVGVAVDRVREQVGPDAAVVEQGVALARGAVADDRLAALGRLDEEPQQVPAHLGHPGGELGVPGQLLQPGGLLPVQHVGHPLGRLAGHLGRPGPQPDGAAVRGQQLDVHERESAARQGPGRGRDRVVLEVLVVDRVVLVLLDQGQQVLHLDGDPAVVGDQGAQPLGEPDHVGDVRVHVVGHDQVRRAVLGADAGAGVRAQELRERGHTRVPRRGADVHRRLDAEAADPPVHHVPAAGTRRCSRPRPRRRRGRRPTRCTASATNVRACSTQEVE